MMPKAMIDRMLNPILERLLIYMIVFRRLSEVTSPDAIYPNRLYTALICFRSHTQSGQQKGCGLQTIPDA